MSGNMNLERSSSAYAAPRLTVLGGLVELTASSSAKVSTESTTGGGGCSSDKNSNRC